MDKKYYIAYGSNLNIAKMEKRCPTAKVVGTSVIEDYQLLFKGSKRGFYLTIEAKKGAKVPVAIWEITKSDEIALDDYEGYPSLYYKKEMILDIKSIHSEVVKRSEAFVYIMQEEQKLGIPSEDYVKACLEGYQAFGFDEKYLYDALAMSSKTQE